MYNVHVTTEHLSTSINAVVLNCAGQGQASPTHAGVFSTNVNNELPTIAQI